MIIPPYRISLSGGGIKGFAHVGALEVLAERNLLHAVKEYIGISAGALCALGLCIGCTLSELRMVISMLDWSLIRDIDPDTLFNFQETFGIDTGANLRRLLAAILNAKHVDPHITFRQLHELKRGPTLRVIATNVNRCRAEEFSYRLTPDVGILFAIQASMTVPIYFTPLKHIATGALYVDGGLGCPSPFKYLDEGEKGSTLSIVFVSNLKMDGAAEISFQEYLQRIYYSTFRQEQGYLSEKWRGSTIRIDCGKINAINFEADQAIRHSIMQAGRRGAEDFLNAPVVKPARRYSVS
jgi:predicted acylesterase/phospholipase RssA